MSAILLIFSIACIASATISYPNYTNAVINFMLLSISTDNRWR